MPKLNSINSHSLGGLIKQFNQLSGVVIDPTGLKMLIAPATATPLPTSEAWQRTVTIQLADANDVVQTWFNASFATTLSIADTSVAGTASIASTTADFVNGTCTVVVSGDAAAWLATETDTLTVASITVAGETVTGGTSVETFTAA